MATTNRALLPNRRIVLKFCFILIMACVVSCFAYPERYLDGGEYGELRSTARVARSGSARGRRSAASDPREAGLTRSQRQEATTAHNMWRRTVSASDMEYMVYNAYLADMMQETVNTCIMEHAFPARRSGMQYRELGQNLYANNWQPLNVTYDIKRWYDEGVWYDIDTDTCSGPQCGHYTQVMWGPSREIGCGYKFCPNVTDWKGKVKLTNAHFFGCNYGPAGNYNHRRPYHRGAPCSRCPDGSFWCDTDAPRGLCRVCGATCEKRGSPNCNCNCQCADGFHGSYCQELCVNTHRWCGTGYPRYACWDRNAGAYIQSVCPVLCGKCTPALDRGPAPLPPPCPEFAAAIEAKTILPGQP